MSLRICLIGCGEHARKVHGPSLRKYASLYPDTALAACCDVDSQRSRRFSEEFGFARHYADYGRMLECEKPDAVSVVLPPALVFSIAREIFSKGIPSLLEKPPGLTKDELKELITQADACGVLNQVAFNRRYTEIINQTYRLLEKHLPPSSVFQITYDMIRFNRWDPDFSTTAIHALDTALFLTRSPYRRASFRYREIPELGNGMIGATIDAESECGTRVWLNFQPVAGVLLERSSIHGLGQSVTVDIPVWGGFDSPGLLRHWKQDVLVTELSGSSLEQGEEMFEQSGFFAENEAFFEAVRHRRTPSPGLREAYQSVVLMEAFRERRRKIVFNS